MTLNKKIEKSVGNTPKLDENLEVCFTHLVKSDVYLNSVIQVNEYF